ncbi:MAG: Trk system potassium transporter TrkA [Halobacteriaceae archaeon]
MRVLVVGAGEVGSSIAESVADTHEVVVVDEDRERVETLTYTQDVLAIAGDGTESETLEEADVEAADVVIASTDDDETNLAICGTVATFTDAFTIARVKHTTYLRTWQRSRRAFDVDFMVGTDLLTAQAIVRIIGLPTARDVDPFAGGQVQMAEFEVPEGSPIADQHVRDADRFEALTFAAIIRDGDVEIPRGGTFIRPGDRVVVIGRPRSVEAFGAAVTPGEVDDAADVVVVGGSSIGYLTASLLEERGFQPRLVEQDPERARELAEDLPRTTVLEHDATDVDFLDREFVGEADVVISALDSDEKGLLASLLASRLGVERTVTVVDEPAYVDVFEAVGVDVAVNPREVTAEEIIRYTREQRTENIAIIESDRAEVLEVEVDADSVLAGRSIRESMADLPEGVVVGALTRDDEVVTPRGDTVVEDGDHVVVFVRADHVDEVISKV